MTRPIAEQHRQLEDHLRAIRAGGDGLDRRVLLPIVDELMGWMFDRGLWQIRWTRTKSGKPWIYGEFDHNDNVRFYVEGESQCELLIAVITKIRDYEGA